DRSNNATLQQMGIDQAHVQRDVPPRTGHPRRAPRAQGSEAASGSREPPAAAPPSRDGARPTRDPDGSRDGAWSTNTSGSEGAGDATRPPRRPDRARSRPTEPIHRAGAADERMQSRRAWARPPARGPRTPASLRPTSCASPKAPSRTPRPAKKARSDPQSRTGRQAGLTYDHPRS